MKILIIDDSRAVQLIIKRALEKGNIQDLEIKLADSGSDALDILSRWHPDLVLSDLHMPKMSGVEFLSEVNKQMLKLNVGLITTETDKSRLAHIKQCGVKFIINKPFNDAELIQKTKCYLPSKQPLVPSKISPKASQNKEQTPQELVALNLPSEADLEDALAETFFRDVKVQLKSYEQYEAHHYPYLLGMMTPVGQDQIKAICILKQPAIKQISHAFASLHPGAVNTQQDRAMLCDHFFRILEPFVTPKETIEPMMFKKSNLITKPFDKITDFYATRGDKKRDYHVEIKGFDAFVITLIAA